MDARLIRAALLAACVLSMGASRSYRTQNFIVTSQTAELSREICQAAEQYRHDLAVHWLGQELPPWSNPCPISVRVGNRLGAGGATSFMFSQQQPFGWQMQVQGSRQRILDSVLPHEVTHTIFATHFGRPLPRWADEGACTTVEHQAEKKKQKQLLVEFLTSGRGIAFNKMFAMKQYPADILPLYAQGYSLARYLIAQGGEQKFVEYLGEGMSSNNWPDATRKHYAFTDLSELQLSWLDWVRQGSPERPGRPQEWLAQQDSPAKSGQRLASLPADENAVSASDVTRLARQESSPAKPRGGGWYARVAAQARQEPQRTAERSASTAFAGRSAAPAVQTADKSAEVLFEWSQQSRPAAESASKQPNHGSRSYVIGSDELKKRILR